MPSSIPTFETDLVGSDSTAVHDHASIHNELGTEIMAIATKLGIDGSLVVGSIDNLLKSAADPGHTHTAYIEPADVDDTPVDGATTDPVSSNWAFDHAAAADPHTGYRLESADHSHQSTGAQAGQIDHGAALTGLSDDDHTQYVLRSILTTNGDLFTRTGGAIARLALGSLGKVLVNTGGAPAWSYPGYVDVKWLGATGDGSTDDTTAIAAAFTAAGAGGTVFFPGNTFAVDSSADYGAAFTLSAANQRVFGSPGATVMLKAGAHTGAHIFDITAAGVEIANLVLDGNDISLSIGVSPRTNGNGARLRNLQFVDCGLAGVYIHGTATDCLIENCGSLGSTYGVLAHDDSTCSHVRVLGGYWDGTGAATGGDAIDFNTPTTGCSDISVIGAHCVNFTTSTASNGIGVGFARVTRALIADCTITGMGLDGIHIEGACTGVKIANNNIATCGRSGIAAVSLSALLVEGITINDNSVTGCLTTAGTGGIAVEGSYAVNRASVAGNIVHNCGRAAATCYGIDVQVGAGHRVANNIVTDTQGATTGGIRITAQTNTRVTGNRAYDTQGSPTQDYGLVVSGTMTEVYVEGNDFNGNGTGDIDESGIGTAKSYIVNGHIYRAGNLAITNETETTIATFTVAAKSLGKNGTIKGRLHCAFYNATGADRALTFRLKAGSGPTTVLDDIHTVIASDASFVRPVTLEVDIMMRNGLADWSTQMELRIGAAANATAGKGDLATNLHTYSMLKEKPTVDFTSDVTITLTAQWNNTGSKTFDREAARFTFFPG